MIRYRYRYHVTLHNRENDESVCDSQRHHHHGS